jgi:large subunit ribosomal protein L29
MKAIEIRNMTKDEIARTLGELHDEHFKLMMRRSSEELPNPLRLRIIKRDIARLKTILREVELKGAEKVLLISQEKKEEKKNK